MVRFFSVNKCYSTTCVRVFAGEHNITCHFFHGQVPDVAEGATACRAAGELGPAAGAYQVPALALQDRRKYIVEAYGALEQGSKVGGHDGGCDYDADHAGHWTTGTATSTPSVCAHVTDTRTYNLSLDDQLKEFDSRCTHHKNFQL